jgi:hypothetical protein
VLGLRAFLRQSFLLEDLAAEPDAYALGDVRRFAVRATSVAHRRCLAQALQAALPDPGPGPELLELIALLEEEECRLDPQAVVSLQRSLHSAAPVEELRSRVRFLAARPER